MRRPNKGYLEIFAKNRTAGALNCGPRTSGVTSWVSNSSVAKGATAFPHWPADQNAEYGKYHVFSTSATVICTGINYKKKTI